MKRHGTWLIVVGLGLAGGLGNQPAVAGASTKRDKSGNDPNFCDKTSRAALKACHFGAHDDYWIAIAQCDNLPTEGERQACELRGERELKAAQEECGAQFQVRQEICGVLGGKPYNPVINPSEFSTVIDNPYFPLKPGTTFIYEGEMEDGFEHIEVFVTHETREIQGVTCVQVHDTVFLDGDLIEDTLDWYAQDKLGDVWYFGENSLELDGGLVVSVEGSWMAGVDGAKAGIIMEAHPKKGDLYRQEFLAGTAEDMGQVLSITETVTIPHFNAFTKCVETKDFTAQEPDAIEHKFFAPNVGQVLTIDVTAGTQEVLVGITTE